MIQEFWQGKRVFLTGHTGFKGTWAALWLAQMGAKVGGYSLPAPTNPSHYEIANVQKSITREWINDIRDLDALRAAISDFEPEIIFHMAAQPLVRLSYDDPIETYQTNVVGTINVLQAARDSRSLKAIVVITTDKCYENKEVIWSYRESDPLGGYDPYSSSKACAEIATASFARSFFQGSDCSVATVRAGNVIGGGDWSQDRLIVDIMRGLIADETIVIRNPKAIRPWQHVLDPLNGYFQLAQSMVLNKKQDFQVWNFGPSLEDQKDVSQITQMVLKGWGGGKIEFSKISGPHEAHFLTLDSTKARHYLHWRPKFNIERSVEETVAWYRAYKNKSDMRNVTLKQIEAFVQGFCGI